METAAGALKLFGSCAEVPVKSIVAVLRSFFIEILTFMTAPLSSGNSKPPSFSTPSTRRTDSSAFAWTWLMYARTTSRPKCSTIRPSSCTPFSLAATCARRSAMFCSMLRAG